MKNRFNRKYRKHLGRMAALAVNVYSFHPRVKTGKFVRKAKELNPKALKVRYNRLVSAWGTDLDFNSIAANELISIR